MSNKQKNHRDVQKFINGVLDTIETANGVYDMGFLKVTYHKLILRYRNMWKIYGIIGLSRTQRLISELMTFTLFYVMFSSLFSWAIFFCVLFLWFIKNHIMASILTEKFNSKNFNTISVLCSMNGGEYVEFKKVNSEEYVNENGVKVKTERYEVNRDDNDAK